MNTMVHLLDIEEIGPASRDRLRDELLDKMQDEEALFTNSELQHMERQLTNIAEQDYEDSRCEFDKVLLNSDGIRMLAEPVAGEDDDTAKALLEEALRQTELTMEMEDDFGMMQDIMPVNSGDKPDSEPIFLDSLVHRLNIGADSSDQLNIKEFSALAMEPKKVKRRKITHTIPKCNKEIKLGQVPKNSAIARELAAVEKTSHNPAKTPPPKKPAQQKMNPRKTVKNRGTRRRSNSVHQDRADSGLEKLQPQPKVKTPPPAGRIDRDDDGRAIIRRGPRGKYTCGRCGARKEGHVCEVKVARSIDTQVDLEYTKHGVLDQVSNCKMMKVRSWVSSFGSPDSQPVPDTVVKQVSLLPQTLSAA